MVNVPEPPDVLTALRDLSLAQVEQRLAELDAERTALSTLRRSLVARDRARRQSRQAEKRELDNAAHREAN
jgi:hypothetical protein